MFLAVPKCLLAVTSAFLFVISATQCAILLFSLVILAILSVILSDCGNPAVSRHSHANGNPESLEVWSGSPINTFGDDE